MLQAFNLKPVAIRRDHAPRQEIVESRAPKNGFFAAGVHGNIASNTGGIGGGRITGKDEAYSFSRFHGPASDHPCAGHQDRFWQVRTLSLRWRPDQLHIQQFFGVDDRG